MDVTGFMIMNRLGQSNLLKSRIDLQSSVGSANIPIFPPLSFDVPDVAITCQKVCFVAVLLCFLNLQHRIAELHRSKWQQAPIYKAQLYLHMMCWPLLSFSTKEMKFSRLVLPFSLYLASYELCIFVSLQHLWWKCRNLRHNIRFDIFCFLWDCVPMYSGKRKKWIRLNSSFLGFPVVNVKGIKYLEIF